MANLFGKSCGSDILNPDSEKQYNSTSVFSLKKDHILLGNESAEAIQVQLDPNFFELNPRTCNSPRLSLKEIDHGTLKGLDDDDHGQYVHISVERKITANHEFTGNLNFTGELFVSGKIRDANSLLGQKLQVLSTNGQGIPDWKSTSELEIDHGELIGTEDDDHEQYVHVSIDRDISANHTFSGNTIFNGNTQFDGVIKDSEGNTPTLGQIPIADSTGKFQWKTPLIENVFWVSKDGNDSNDGLSPQTAKASIKAAVRASHSGTLGKIMDAAESILANKKFIIDEVINQLYTRSFTLPNSTSFDLKTRQAYRQILANRDSIVSSSVTTISTSNPELSNIQDKCTRDSKYLLLAIAKDIFYGGYENSYKFASGYFDVNHEFRSSIFSPTVEKTLTISVFNEIETALQTLLSGSTYIYVRARIDELFGYVTGSINSESLTNFPSKSEQESLKSEIYYNLDALVNTTWNATLLTYPTIGSTETTCKRDIKLIAIAAAEDINIWGNANVMHAAKSYFDQVGIFSTSTEREASVYAYQQLRNSIKALVSKQALKSKVDSIFSPLITALNNNTDSGLVDYDAGVLNKSARLCNRDLGYFIDAISSDMKNGGNVFSIEFAEEYYDGNNLEFISGQLSDTIWAFNRARELMILAMKNWRINPSDDAYVPNFSLERIFVDNSIVYEDDPACANAETAINNYYGIIEYILQNGPNADAKKARDLIYEEIGKGDDPTSIVNYVWRETAVAYPSIEFTEGKCKRDIILVLEGIARDLYSGGNSNTIAVTRSYFPDSGNPIETQITESVYAYNLAKDFINTNILSGSQYSQLRDKVTDLFSILTIALTNGNLDSLPTESTGTWTLQQPSYKTTIFVNPGVYWEDNPIHLPPNTVVTGNSLRGITVNAMNRTLDLFHVNNACGLSFMTFQNHLAPSYAVSFPKKNNQGIAGIISRSPYVQQCTSITTTGGGMLVDGAITEGFKSMVLDSYTQYNQGGPGVKIINNGYAQLVSLFTISCSAGIECASGGQCDLTNSNSSLGDYGLVADGVGNEEILATVLEDIPAGETRIELKIPGVLKPYNGQVGFFGTKYYSLKEIKIKDGGSGYESVPTITIGTPSGPQGIPARARAIVENGSISDVTIIKGGTAYTEIPTVTITPPTAVGAVAATYEVVMEPIYYQIVSSTDIAPDSMVTVTLVNPTLYPISKGTSFSLFRQSKVLASGHSFEYIGAGADIKTALPIRNGTFIQQQEIEEKNGGSVIYTSTDQSGNFRIGDGVIIDQTSGTIGGVSFSRGLFAQITPLILALQ